MNPSLNTNVLKGNVIGMDSQVVDQQSLHLLLLIKYLNGNVRQFAEIAINESSKIAPSSVQYVILENFDKIDQVKCQWLNSLNPGYTILTKDLLSTYGLDYLSYNLDWTIDNHVLSDKLRLLIQNVEDNLDNVYELYTYGTKFDSSTSSSFLSRLLSTSINTTFGFVNHNGIHNCHMNQLNSGKFAKDNGWHQDGGLIIHNISTNEWTAIFIKFQCQK